jgi:hypothetical protein
MGPLVVLGTRESRRHYGRGGTGGQSIDVAPPEFIAISTTSLPRMRSARLHVVERTVPCQLRIPEPIFRFLIPNTSG